jgi:hypothetical protein
MKNDHVLTTRVGRVRELFSCRNENPSDAGEKLHRLWGKKQVLGSDGVTSSVLWAVTVDANEAKSRGCDRSEDFKVEWKKHPPVNQQVGRQSGVGE